MHQDLRSSFIGMLLEDVARAEAAHQANPDQRSKRDVVRTSFAAIEGAVWIFREHIRAMALATDELSEPERIALSEISYNVDRTGRLAPQAKFLTLPATIRLCSRIAERISPAANIDFSSADWPNFKAAIEARNRIAHPKVVDDLMMSGSDVQSCSSALHWFLEASTRSMEETASVARTQVNGIRDVLNDLKSGDEETTRLYRSLITGEESPI
jgi:hypothetical protein